MSHFIIKGTVVSVTPSEDGKRTKVRISETVKDKTQLVEVSKFGSAHFAVGQRVEIVGRIRTWQSKTGDYLNTALDAEEIYLAGNAIQPAYSAPAGQPPTSPGHQPQQDEDVPF